jgi:hypothetical protein
VNVLCPSCDAEWLPAPGIVAHDDDCPRLAAMRVRDGRACKAAATGFCGCGAAS